MSQSQRRRPQRRNARPGPRPGPRPSRSGPELPSWLASDKDVDPAGEPIFVALIRELQAAPPAPGGAGTS